jgi:hypothetical protein
MNVRHIALSSLSIALLAIVGPAGAEPGRTRPVSPLVPVATPEPVRFELALDELELLWRPVPGGRHTVSISTAGVLGAAVRAQRGGQAIVTMATVDDAAALAETAQRLRRANPGAIVKPVFYEAGTRRSGATRRIGTSGMRLVVTPGATAETVIAAAPVTIRRAPEPAGAYGLQASDPMAALALTTALAGRPGVASLALSAVPERVQRKHDRLVASGRPLQPFDEPEEALEFFALKRRPAGDTAVPVERYRAALEHMKLMPRRSTRSGITLPSVADAGHEPSTAILSSWTPLGPGNVGGRTRGLVIDPNGTTMYAAGVAGGVWKSTNGGASWTPTSDLLANIAVNSLAIDPNHPNVLYAGTGEGYFNIDAVRGNGIYKTTNSAGTWTQLGSTATPDFRFVNKIVVSRNDTSRLYAATRTGVFRSPDAGGSWTKVLTPSTTTGCTDLVIRTDQGTDYLLAACGASTVTQGTVYRNPDAAGSGTWTPVLGAAQGEGQMGRTSLAIAPSNQDVVYALTASNVTSGNFKAGGLHAVFRSTDGGQTWSARVRNTSPTKLNTVLLTNPVIAFLTECGESGSEFNNQGWYDNVIAVDPADADRVWVGGIDLFRSDDGGANWGLASYWWVNTSNPRYAHADQHVIVFHPGYDGTTNKTMFVGNDGGLFRTTDARAATASGPTAPCAAAGGMTWSNLNNGYGVTQFYHGLPYPGGATYFGGTQDNGTLRGNDAGGFAWSRIQGGDGGYVAIDPGNTSVLYAEFTRLSIQKSTNGGSSFSDAVGGITEPTNNFLFINPFVMDPSNAQRLWTGGLTMWRTADGAGQWNQASSNLCGEGSVSAIAVAPSNPNRVAAGMSDGCVNRTASGLTSTGATGWDVSQPLGPAFGYVSWLTFDPANDSVLYATYSTFGVPHVWRSTDGGGTWTPIDGTGVARIPDVPVHSLVVDPGNSARLFVGTDVGVFSSDDTGTTWAVENTGFANVITEALAVGNVGATPHVFAFTHGRGAWRVPVAAASAQLSLTLITSGTTFHDGHTLNVSVAASNPGLPIAVDYYLGALLPDGNTIVFVTSGGTSRALGSFANLASYQPALTGIPVSAPFTGTVPAYSYTFTGTEPTGTYTVFVEARRAGSTELVARGQAFITVTH